jgi:hypothetical protein
MNAARYIGNGALEVVDTEAPQPSPGEVQLEVAYTGICGTDLHILHGGMDVRVTMPAANFWLYNLDNDKYFAAPPGPAMKASANLIWKGWSMVTYPDQPSWSNQVVAKLIQLMQAEDALTVLATAPPDTDLTGNGADNAGTTR